MHARQPRFRRSTDASQYDLLLALMPIPLVSGLLYAATTGVPLALGAGLGGVPSALLLGYGLFVAPPLDRRRKRGGVSADRSPPRRPTR